MEEPIVDNASKEGIDSSTLRISSLWHIETLAYENLVKFCREYRGNRNLGFLFSCPSFVMLNYSKVSDEICSEIVHG
jgi:hypothetical protein